MQKEDAFWWRLVNLNPTLWRALIMGIVALLASIGILVSDNIPDAIVGLIITLTAIIQGLWTRGAVTPNAKVVSYLADPAEQSELSAGEATTTATARQIVEAATTKGG